ncbi:MAG: gliding motility-associated C-terminal domain-containing protein [Bacteroidales bacterium]|jgi:hypothetical protein|nr:gliding motility-associated C-terminal domain-containing protein [Bacteroidales bacterium]
MLKINILSTFVFLCAFISAQQTPILQQTYISQQAYIPPQDAMPPQVAIPQAPQDAETEAVKPLTIIYSANVVCEGDTVFLTKDDSPLGTLINPVYVWDINGTTHIEQTHKYVPQQEVTRIRLSIYVEAILVAFDTANIYMTQKPETTVEHDTICYGDEAQIGIQGGKYWYWNTNQVSQQINIRPFYTTPYTVFSSEYPVNRIGYTNICYTVDTAWVIVHRDISSPVLGDTIVCSGMEYTYSVKDASSVIWWDENTENPRSIVIDRDTTLSYTGLSKNGCRMQGTLSVKVVANSEGGIEGGNSFCIGDTVVLSIGTSAANIKWFNGDTAAEIRFVANVSFTVYCQISTEDGEEKCAKKLEHPIEVKECLSMFFPSGFKPDGVTPTYGPVGIIDPVRKYEFSIYNRVGERIFETTDLTVKWDGKVGGKDAPSGVYIYQYRETVERFTFERKGIFTLVR